MNSRFPILSTISTLIRVLGIIIAIAAVLTFLIRFNNNLGEAIVVLVGGLIAAIYMYAIAELIGVAFAIEQNTRQSSEYPARQIAGSGSGKRQSNPIPPRSTESLASYKGP